MALRWLDENWEVFGTFRTQSTSLSKLSNSGIQLFHCDLSDPSSIESSCKKIIKSCETWDVLVLCPGSQDPIGSFETCVFNEWEASIRVNFTSQLRIVHEMLPYRKIGTSLEPCIIFFAGGGTNNAVVDYSAYTISKIALIKMCELLDAEIQDARFAIIGPGWVKTKIHKSTFVAGNKAGANHERTKRKFENDEFTPMEDVINCCEWIIRAPRNIVSGRNFSVVFDAWGADDLKEKLASDDNMYKLRRYGNDFKKRNAEK